MIQKTEIGCDGWKEENDDNNYNEEMLGIQKRKSWIGTDEKKKKWMRIFGRNVVLIWMRRERNSCGFGGKRRAMNLSENNYHRALKTIQMSFLKKKNNASDQFYN